MAAGEYISVASQKDAEEADVEKERAEQQKGPSARLREFEELVGKHGISPGLGGSRDFHMQCGSGQKTGDVQLCLVCSSATAT